MTVFDDAFATLMQNEGGFSNNPDDPGKETMYGVTERVARGYGYTGAMRDLTLDMAKAIAKTEYWDIYRCDELPPRLAFQVLDAAYNGGRVAQWLQQAVNVNVDGHIGPLTLQAAERVDEDKAIMRFIAYRLDYLTECQDWASFSKGWSKRIKNNLLKAAE